MSVYCETCDHFLLVNKSDPPWRALCTKHKNEGGFGFVSMELWDSEAPYLRCVDMNPKGTCPMWKRKRDNQMEMDGCVTDNS